MRTTTRTIVKTKLAILSLLFFCFSSFAQQVAKTIPNSTSPDGLIGFLEFKPSDYGTQKHPLIIFLHGIGERGNGTSQINSVAANAIPLYCSKGATMRFSVAGQTSSFVVLSPQLSSSYGYWPSFYVSEMVKYAKANLQIDPNRIYVTGLSLGGGGVWGAITDAANPTFDAGIAAAAPVCGTQQEDDAMFCSTIGTNHLPVWAFHSMDDGTVNVAATQHAEILAKNCGLSPAAKFTYYQTGGHSGAWVNAYDTGHITKTVNVSGALSSFTANPNLYEWFLGNTRSTTSTPAYTAPTASAGAAQTITLPVSTVTLTGAGAGTNGATVTSYAWTKTSGPAGAVIVSAASTATSVTGLLQGTYVFTLMVTDNHGLSTSAAATITVNAAATTPAAVNLPPVSFAGAGASVTLPTNSIALDGSGSYDSDGKIAEYYWSQSSGPSTATIANNFSATTTASNLVQGTYVFVLQAKDNAGAMSYSTKIVMVNATVTSVVNQKPVSAAGADAAVTLPANSIALNGNASYDSDGTIVEYYWAQSSGPSTATIGNNFSVSTTASNLVQGTYIFVLQVKDNAGAMGYSMKTVTVKSAITVAAGNQSPVSNAGADAAVTLPTSTVSLNGSASYDSDGTIIEYYWSQSSGPSSSSIANNFAVSTTASNLVPGTYIFVLQAKDDKGGMGYSLKKVTVSAAGATTAATSVTTAQPVGYIKISTGPYQACDDASSTGRTGVYGSSIANGTILYTDASKTTVYNGGWNWFSFTPVAGGATSYAFAIFPDGSIALLRDCVTGTYLRTALNTTTAEQDKATLQRLKDSAAVSLLSTSLVKLRLYPNPVHSSATIELNSTDNGVKIVNLYNANGILKAKYSWSTTPGSNLFSLKDISTLANGFYVLEVTDSRGKRIGTQKFLKM